MSSIDQNASVYSPGVTFSKDDTCTIEYHVTPYLYEIRKMRITVVRANAEKSVRLMDTSISYDGARYSLPSWLQERLNSGRGVVTRYVRYFGIAKDFLFECQNLYKSYNLLDDFAGGENIII